MAVAAEHEVHVLRIELGSARIDRVVDQGDDHVSLALILELLGLLVHFLRRVGDVQALDVVRAGLALGQVRGGAHQCDLHALDLDDAVRVNLAGAVFLVNVRAELDALGARDNTVDQVVVTLIKLVVAHRRSVRTDGVKELHRVLIVRDRGDERGATLVVAGGSHQLVLVLGTQVVDDAGNVRRTHLIARLRDELAGLAVLAQASLKAAVEVREVGNVDLHLLIFCGECRHSGDDECGRRGGSHQGTEATVRKHEKLLCFKRCGGLYVFSSPKSVTSQRNLGDVYELSSAFKLTVAKNSCAVHLKARCLLYDVTR